MNGPQSDQQVDRLIRAFLDERAETAVLHAASADEMASRLAPIGTRRWTVHRPAWIRVGRRTQLSVAAAVIAVLLIASGLLMVTRLADQRVASPTTRPSSTQRANGSVPEVLRQAWQRPTPVVPGLDRWGSGFLRLEGGRLTFGQEPDVQESTSAVSAAGLDRLIVTATVATPPCEAGDVGAYRWSVEGKDTVMILTAVGADACAARETELAGSWVRSDLPPRVGDDAVLSPGTHLTSAFAPVSGIGSAGQLSFTVPEGWRLNLDQPARFALHHFSADPQRQPLDDTFILLIAPARMAADFETGSRCMGIRDAPGVGRGVHDIVAAIRARTGVRSLAVTSVTIDGHTGQMLDLSLVPSWTGGCQAPEGPAVGIPVVHEGGSDTGAAISVGPDHPVRLILLDLGAERTLAIGIFSPVPSSLDDHVAGAMPIIDSFEFHLPGS